MQPEEQHGFRQGRRIEGHLLTANVCLQKTLAASTPPSIISLDLSKAFDKIDWNAIRSALRQHAISEHLIFIFFLHAFFSAIRSQRTVLLGSFQALGLFLYWPVSRSAIPKAKSINKSRMLGREAAGVCWVWPSCARRSLRGGGSPSRL